MGFLFTGCGCYLAIADVAKVVIYAVTSMLAAFFKLKCVESLRCFSINASFSKLRIQLCTTLCLLLLTTTFEKAPEFDNSRQYRQK